MVYTESMSKQQAQCRDCGSTDVEWRQSKAGKWYLAQLQHGPRGSVYSDGPHYRACTARGPKADHLRAIKEHNAKVEAERAAHEAKLQAMFAAGDYEGMKRYLNGEDK